MTTSLLPPGAYHQHTAILGKTGAGKSYAARGIVERLLGEGKRVVVIDPKGDWWGLRLNRTGKGPGFPVVIFGGPHADVPVNDRAGSAIAELVATGNRPAILDLSELTNEARVRIFADFAHGLFRLNKMPLWVVIDECHNFAPQGRVEGTAATMLHWSNRMASEGRGKNIQIVMASQRPQKVHKDFLTCAETLVAMRVVHVLDRTALKEWMDGAGNKELSARVLSELASMPRGEAFVWSPELGFFERRKAPAIDTYDSMNPQSGMTADSLKGWADVDMEAVKTKMADAVREAEANDPKLLRKRIAELEAEARKKASIPAPAPVSAPVEVSVLTERDREFLKEAADEIERHAIRVENVKSEIMAACENLVQGLDADFDDIKAARAGVERILAHVGRAMAPHIPSSGLARRGGAVDAAPRRPVAASPASGAGPGSVPRGAARKILTALAQAGRALTNRQIGSRAGLATSGGTWGEAMALLRREGWISDQAVGKAITEAGIAALGDYTPLPTGKALRDYWIVSLKPLMASRILEYLCSIYPRDASNEEIGRTLGCATSGGTWGEAMSKLRSLELISGGRGCSTAAAELFE